MAASLIEPEASLLERDKPITADDQVIQHVNLQKFAGLDDGARYHAIFR